MEGDVVVIIFWIGVAVAVLWVSYGSEWGKRTRREAAERKAARKAKYQEPTLTKVGKQSPAGLACPKCGGTQFTARRKLSTKLVFGLASLLGEAQYVVCVTCGTRYRRG